jgi:hypothetical protein
MGFSAHIPRLGCPWHEGDEVPHQLGEQAFDLLKGGGHPEKPALLQKTPGEALIQREGSRNCRAGFVTFAISATALIWDLFSPLATANS